MKEEIKNLTELAGPRAYINIGKIMDENKNLKFMKRDYNRLKN